MAKNTKSNKRNNKKTSSISDLLDCFSSQSSFENLMITVLCFMIPQNHLDRYTNRRGNFIVYNFPLVYLVNTHLFTYFYWVGQKVWELWRAHSNIIKNLFFNTGTSSLWSWAQGASHHFSSQWTYFFCHKAASSASVDLNKGGRRTSVISGW